MSDAHGPQRLSDEPATGFPPARPTVITPTSPLLDRLPLAGTLRNVLPEVTHQVPSRRPKRSICTGGGWRSENTDAPFCTCRCRPLAKVRCARSVLQQWRRTRPALGSTSGQWARLVGVGPRPEGRTTVWVRLNPSVSAGGRADDHAIRRGLRRAIEARWSG
jgi:hypothetical protein